MAEQSYKDILRKTKQLASELKLNNSLELSNLFTYLLWNGYFSKDNLLKFQTDKRLLITNYYGFDIMNGIGVCLNFSDMLSDFLNQFDYNVATIFNIVSKKVKTDYMPTVKRESSKSNFRQRIISAMASPLSNVVGNHAFNFICENDGFYIYDSTNLMMFNLEDKFNCSNVCGTGSAKIKPYFSHYLNDSDKSLLALVDLNEK